MEGRSILEFTSGEWTRVAEQAFARTRRGSRCSSSFMFLTRWGMEVWTLVTTHTRCATLRDN